MTPDLMLSLLDRANTAAEILAMLDKIVFCVRLYTIDD